MRIRLPLAFKFITPLILVLALIGYAVNTEINKSIKTTLINQASSFVVNFVQLQALRRNVEPQDFTPPATYESDKAFGILADEVKARGIVRVKAWSPSNVVLFSDDKSIIGKQFLDNPELTKSLAEGVPKIEISKPVKQDNKADTKYNDLLEIYIPIYQAGNTKPIGVIETYYELSGLLQALEHAQNQVLQTTLIGFFVLAVTLTALLYRFVIIPLNKLGRLSKRVGKGHFSSQRNPAGDDEIGDLFKAFHHMSKGLENLQQLKNEFVYVAAHELRAPVTIIRGYISMIKEKHITQKDGLAEIQKANMRLEQLVNDLLEIARSDSGKLDVKVQPVALLPIVQKNLLAFESVARERKIKLVPDLCKEDVTVLADPKKLDEILANLISNAIKYGRESGFIIISVKRGTTEGILSVEDNGNGIPAAAQKQLFHKFYRTPEALASETTGTGLGLYITKELVVRMKGRISFKSELGTGTTFTVALQLDRPRQKGISPPMA